MCSSDLASDLVFKNINVQFFSSCIVFSSGAINVRVENTTLSFCGSHGIFMPASSGGHTIVNNNLNKNFIGIFVSSSNNIIESNSFSLHSVYGIRTHYSSNNIIKNNTFLNGWIGVYIEYGFGNKVTNNTIQNNIFYGLYAFGSSDVNQNYIVNNNFINNGGYAQVNVYQVKISDVLPIGGNYWSNYDELGEGCFDINNDFICDNAISFGRVADSFPWKYKDGWKGAPPTCSDGIMNQDETGVDTGGVCRVLSSEKIITSFIFTNLTPNVDGVIDEAAHIISLNIPFGTDVTDLTPAITISSDASINPDNNISQDFSMPVTYTVTAEDGSTQNYTVTVTANCTVDCFSSVLFLPGLEASRLYKQKTVLGFPVEDQLWEPNVNSDVEDLYLNTDGTSKNSGIYTRDVVRETNTPIPTGPAGQNIYKSFVDMLGKLVDDFKIVEYELFAYDWRQSVEDIVNNGTKYEDGTLSLVDTLQSLVTSSKNGKVTIIAHSNGGLLAKALLKKLQDDKNAGKNNLIDNVDVLILVAVPEIGTAKAVPAILHGYEQRLGFGWLMDEIHARELGRNMLSAFGLLPSREYINHVSASPVTFVDNAIPSNVTTKLFQAFGSALDSYDEYKSFLFGGEGRIDPAMNQTKLPISLSQNLFAQVENLHDSIDSWIPPSSMRVIEVAGWGLDTVASFEYYPKTSCAGSSCIFILDQKPRFTSDGDKTVVVPSAHYMGFLGSAEKYWVNLKSINDAKPPFVVQNSHGNILEVSSVLNLISDTIQKLPINNLPHLYSSMPTDNSNRLRLSIHSPVTLDAYDTQGNHTGKICPPDKEFCYVEENILNSSYLEFGEGKYINLPEDQMAKVKLQGTDIGTFTYISEQVFPTGSSNTSFFVDIPVTTQTQAEVTLNSSTQIPELKLDVRGDGVNDFTLAPSDTFDPVTYLQIMKATISSLDLPQAKVKTFNNRVDNIIKSIQKGKIDKAKLKAEKFKSVLEKKLAKPDPKKPKPKKLSKTDAQLLLDMLNKLLDNIS